MRYAGITYNDVVNCPGIGVSIYLQGCDLHCPGCHNSAIWDFKGGKEFTYDTLLEVEKALTANNIHRSLCILGGEPLAEANLFTTSFIIEHIKLHMPEVKIYLWSGYTLQELEDRNSNAVNYVLNNINYLIDGRYIAAKRDVSLFMKGSSNQCIYDMKTRQKVDSLEKIC